MIFIKSKRYQKINWSGGIINGRPGELLVPILAKFVLGGGGIRGLTSPMRLALLFMRRQVARLYLVAGIPGVMAI